MLMVHKRFMTQSGERYPENEVVGVAKWQIIRTIWERMTC